MVAIINTGKSIRRAFQYNENKLKEGAATLLTIENVPFNVTQSNENMRLKMLEKVNALRPDVSVNSVHISLNFSPEEQLSDDKMEHIAKDYMDRIGFGEQPYLVYRHMDAGHEHCHIVTTNVTLEGDRISLHHLANTKSEPARIELEKEYGLIKAEDHKQELLALNPADASKIKYGKVATKRAIGNVLAQVIEQYRFTSLSELNAVLNLYNVQADTGKEGSRLNKYGGLQYSIIDATGNPIGVPIKASLFYQKPILKKLEKLFLKNDVARQRFKQRLQTAIAFALKTKQPKSLNELKKLLHRENIRLIPRQNTDGVIYGVTYVDLRTKCVFNGSALGKLYSAKALLSTIHLKDSTTAIKHSNGLKDNLSICFQSAKTGGSYKDAAIPMVNYSDEKSLLELLTQHEFAASGVPYEWRKKKKKRKKQ